MATNTPSFQTWRTPSSSGQGLAPATIKERQLAALASYVTQQTPNGNGLGS